MKVLMLSGDNNIFKEGSGARERMLEYGKLFEELHIVIQTATSDKRQATRIDNNVFVYPTNSKSKWFCIFDAVRIGGEIIQNFSLREISRRETKFKIQNSVITCQDPFEIGLAGYLLKKKFRLPLQIQIHTDVFSPYFWRESLRNKIRVLLAKFLLPRADGIRVVSERIKKSLLTLYPKSYTLNSIFVLPIFVDIEKIKSAPIKTNLRKKYPNYDFIILMASRLTREKNISLALKAFCEVIKKYPKTGLIIVGSGSEEENLKLTAKRYTLNANVVFEPWADDLASYYKTADLFLLTSNYEGYGRTVVEAMAAGLSVAMTNVGLAGEMVIDGANGIVASSKKELTEKILPLIRSKDKMEKFKEYSRNLLEKWPSKEEYLNRYKKLLEVLL